FNSINRDDVLQGQSPEESGPWLVRVPHDVDAAAFGGLEEFGMMVVLEGYCRGRSFGWPGNAGLETRWGCGPTQRGEKLRRLQRLGNIHCVQVAPDPRLNGGTRLGIYLLRRIDASLPVEDDPRSQKAADRLWRARGLPGNPPQTTSDGASENRHR